MTDTPEAQRETRRRRHEAIRAEVADEESEAAEAEAAESRATLDVPMHLRIDKELDNYLRDRAARDGIPVSALVRQILRGAAQQQVVSPSQADIEAIARRVAREELQHQ